MDRTKNKKYMKSSFYIILTVLISKEKDGNWVATCKELGTSTYGDTIEEVSQEIKELVILHLTTLEKAGERKRFFTENNIRTYTKKPNKVEIDTPLNRNVYVEAYAQNLVSL